MKLSYKAFALILPISVFGVGGLCYFESIRQLQENETLEEEFQRALIKNVAPTLENALWNFDKNTLSASLNGLFAASSITSAGVYTPNADFFIGNARDQEGIHRPVENYERFKSIEEADERWKSVLGSIALTHTMKVNLYKPHPEANEGKIQIGTVDINYNTSRGVERAKKAILQIAVTGMISSILMIALLFGLIQLIIANPLRSLVKVSRLLAAGEFNHPVPVKGNDEIGILAQSFEYMRIKIKEFTDHLQLMVDQKTSELQSSNKLLQNALHDLEVSQQQNISNSRMAALGEMAGGVAHEVNNPVAIIKGYAERSIVELKKNPPPIPRIIELQTFIAKSCVRIATIVKSLQLFSRDGSNESFDLIPLVQLFSELMPLYEEKLRTHNIAWKLEIEPELSVCCRQVQLGQVIMNLVLNAADAICNLEDRWVHVQCAAHESFVRITVTDSGPGIPPDILAKIFNPFFTSKAIGKGTGLGLSLSKGIVDAHHGRLYVATDHPNTRFVIELPKEQGLRC